MKCKDCKEFGTKYFGEGANRKYDGHKCGITGRRVGSDSVIVGCQMNPIENVEEKK